MTPARAAVGTGPPRAAAVPGAGARERVLAAAVDLFAEHGYDGTSVAQVINRAGVAKGGFYHHFPSKEALLYEVYGDLIGRQLHNLEDILARRDTAAVTLRAVIDDLVRTTAASIRPALVFWREMNKLGSARTAQYRRARRRYHDTVRRIVRDGQATGEFGSLANADTVTFTIFGYVNELPLWYRPNGRKRPAQLATELADLMLAALAAKDPEVSHGRT